MSLEETDKASAAVATHPRVSLEDIKNNIAEEYYFTGAEAIGDPDHEALRLLTIYILVMKNGFTFIGKSAPASPENFNASLGAKLAYEDAVRQVWPMMGYALREKLSQQ